MNNILGDLLDQCIVIYLDDILVYSDDPVQHREHIWEILKLLEGLIFMSCCPAF